MLPQDQDAFLRFVRESDPVTVVQALDASSQDVRPEDEVAYDRLQALCFWNRRLLPVLKRTPLPKGAGCYKYQLDVLHLPLLEFSNCVTTKWEASPALIQGRLYGQFDAYLKKPVEFQKWYERLVRWIRKGYRRNPAKTLGGYVGPAAYEFYEKGGYLLPSFLPPRTEAWLTEIRKQHPDADLAGPSSSHSSKHL